MDADELFDHALSSLPEAVGDLLRDGKDPREFVFASFDGASQLGRAFIATDLAVERGEDSEASRAEVQRMLVEAEQQGEEVIVSFMLPCDSVTRLLEAGRRHAPRASRSGCGSMRRSTRAIFAWSRSPASRCARRRWTRA